MRGSLWSSEVLSAYTSSEPSAGDGFESWRPGATHLTAAIMAKQHYGSQTFYLDHYQYDLSLQMQWLPEHASLKGSMTLAQTLQTAFAWFGGIVALGSGSAAIAYGLFRWLGKSWLDQHFKKQLERLKHDQQKEIKQFRH